METATSGEVEKVEATRESSDLSFREALEKNMAKEPEVQAKEPAKEAAPSLPEKQINEPQKAETKAEIPPPVATPADMTAEEKEVFSKADPKLQAYLSRRAYETRAAFSREMQKVQDANKYYENLNKAIQPHQEYLSKKGLTPDIAINRAIAWERAFETDRIGAAKEYLAAQGVDIYELLDENGQTPQQQQPQQQIDPNAIKQEIWSEINQQIMQEHEAKTTEQHLNAVEKFKSSKILFKDPNTALQLEADLAPIIESLARQNPSARAEDILETAYNYVTRGNESYSRLLDAYGQREKAEQARMQAEKAKQASRSVSGSIAGANPTSKGLDFREELRLRMQGGM